MAEVQVTRERLAELLREAEHAHGEYERELGRRDEDWPAWYAGFILERLGVESSTSSGDES